MLSQVRIPGGEPHRWETISIASRARCSSKRHLSYVRRGGVKRLPSTARAETAVLSCKGDAPRPSRRFSQGHAHLSCTSRQLVGALPRFRAHIFPPKIAFASSTTVYSKRVRCGLSVAPAAAR
jgi:hypothetical protein